MNTNLFLTDIFREVSTIAAGKSSTALAQMLDMMVNVSVPEIKFVLLKDVLKEIGEDYCNKEVIGIYFRFFGGIEGSILYCISYESAKKMLNILMGEEFKNFNDTPEIIKAALKEVGNIVVNSYINSIAEFLALEKTVISVPFYSNDFLSAILDTILAQAAEVSDDVLLFNTKFETKEFDFESKILVFVNQESIAKVYSKLEEMVKKYELK